MQKGEELWELSVSSVIQQLDVAPGACIQSLLLLSTRFADCWRCGSGLGFGMEKKFETTIMGCIGLRV